MPNTRHKSGDRLPCLSGHANIGGVDYKIAMWAPKPGKKGYFMTAQIPQAKAEEKPAEAVKPPESLPEVVDAPPPEPIQQTLTNCDF